MDISKYKYKVVVVFSDINGKEIKREVHRYESIVKAHHNFFLNKATAINEIAYKLVIKEREIINAGYSTPTYFTYAGNLGITIALCHINKDFPMDAVEFWSLHAKEREMRFDENKEEETKKIFWPGYEGGNHEDI